MLVRVEHGGPSLPEATPRVVGEAARVSFDRLLQREKGDAVAVLELVDLLSWENAAALLEAEAARREAQATAKAAVRRTPSLRRLPSMHKLPSRTRSFGHGAANGGKNSGRLPVASNQALSEKPEAPERRARWRLIEKRGEVEEMSDVVECLQVVKAGVKRQVLLARARVALETALHLAVTDDKEAATKGGQHGGGKKGRKLEKGWKFEDLHAALIACRNWRVVARPLGSPRG